MAKLNFYFLYISLLLLHYIIFYKEAVRLAYQLSFPDIK